jgi:glycerophosphoryl diester phosphodiesterase
VKLLLLASLALGCLAALSGPSPSESAGPTTLFAAHRGGALLWPENSLLAFRNAAEVLGADFLEFDVHVSRDGEVMVIHDPTLDRTTDGRGPVRERTLAELRALRLRDHAGTLTTEAVPSLDEVAGLAMRLRREMLLEIKLDDRGRAYPGIEEKVFAVLDRHRATPATVVMAFEPETWRRARALRPDARVAALYSRRTLSKLGSSLERELDEAQRAGVTMVGLEQGLVNAETLARVRGAGMTPSVWTVNDADAIRRFIDLGVSVVITDRPDLAKSALGR